MPSAVTTDGPRTSAAQLPVAEICVSHSAPDRDQEHAGGERRAPAEPGDEPRGERRGDGERARHRQEGEARLHGRQAEDLLQVEREEEPHREHRGAHQADDDVGAGERARAEDRHRDERHLRPALLDRDEQEEQRDPDADAGDDLRRAEPVALDVHDAEHERDLPGGERDGSGDVEVPLREVAAALDDVADGERDQHGADRHVDEQDPAPAQRLGEHAAEQRARRSAAGGDGAPDAQRAVALGPFGEGRRDDRQRGRRDDRAAEALQPAGRHEQAGARRQRAEQRGEREHGDADDEHPLAPEQVARAAAEHQEPGEGHRVRAHHPLQVVLGEVQRGADGRQRDVHDRHVEDHHELRGAGDQQDQPGVGRAAGGGHASNGSSRRTSARAQRRSGCDPRRKPASSAAAAVGRRQA